MTTLPGLLECPVCHLMHLRRIVEDGVCSMKADRPLADRAATAAATATTETEQLLEELRAEVAALQETLARQISDDYDSDPEWWSLVARQQAGLATPALDDREPEAWAWPLHGLRETLDAERSRAEKAEAEVARLKDQTHDRLRGWPVAVKSAKDEAIEQLRAEVARLTAELADAKARAGWSISPLSRGRLES